MNNRKHQLVFLFAASFFVISVTGGIVILLVCTGPLRVAVAGLFLAALIDAGIFVAWQHRRSAGFQTLAQELPEDLKRQMRGQLPEAQFQMLCQAYTQQNAASRNMRIDRFLERLLADNSHTHVIENLDEQVNDILHNEDFGYRWSYFCLAYIELEDYSSYMLKNCDGRLLLNDFRRMYEVVYSAFDGIFNSVHIAHGVEWKNAWVFLVNLSGTTTETPREQLERTVDKLCGDCEKMVAQVRESFNVSLEMAISTPYRDINETHGIFDWMLTMKEYSDFVYGPRAVIGPADLQQYTTRPHPAPSAMEKTYYSALLAEDFVKAEQALYDLEQYALVNNGFSIAALKDLLLLCLSTAEEVATSNTISTERVSSTDWRSGLQNAETLEQMNELIHTFFQFLISRSEQRQHEWSGTARKIVAFLDENYANPDLSITMLADSLHLSVSYISRIFKRETGQNVPDYIHEKRVAMAKELLANTELTINEVAAKVGYATAWTMNRVFKRNVNMTPGAYRKLARSSKEAAQT